MTATAAPSVTVPAGSEELADQAAPLDSLLVQATRSPLRRFVPTVSTAKFAAGLVRHPVRSGRRLAGLAGELTQVAVGTSAVTPSRRDRRFTDTAWTDNPILRRLVQAYLATGQAAEDLVTDADLDWRDAERVHFLVENLTQALAPSNVPLLNPASAKAVIDTAGHEPGPGRPQPGDETWPAPRGYRRWWTPPRSRWAGTSPPPRRRGAPHRDVRADPVRAADRTGPPDPAADRAAHHQQELRAGPRARPQPGRIPRPAGSAGVHDLLAQPGCPARRLGPGRLRRRRCWRRWPPSNGSPVWRAPRWPGCAPAASSPAWPRPTWPRPAGRTGWPRSPCW